MSAGSPRAAGLHDHPRRPGGLRRGQRRPQPDPPGRGGRPQRRAARRDRARHVHDGAGRPGRRRRGSRTPRWSASAASSPTRSSCPPRAASRSRSPARSRRRATDGLHHGRAHRHLRRPEGARHAQGRAAWLSGSPTTPPCASAAPPPASSRATHRGRAGRRRRAPPTRPASRCWCSAAAATSWSPTRASPAPWCEVATRGVSPTSRATTPSPAAACVVTRRGRRGLGRPGRPRRRARLGRRRGAVRHPRLAWAPPRSRTSAPTARRSPRPSPRSGSGTATLRGRPHLRQRRLRLRLPAQPVQGRPAAATSCSSVDLPAPPGRPRRPGRVRRAGPHARRRARRAGAAGRRPRGRAAPARRQGHGARRRRPRHLERGLVLHQPVRRRRPRVPDGAPGLAAARRHGQDQRRLADRARRLRQGATATGPVGLSTKHTLALTNRGGATHRRPAGPGPRGPRRRGGARSASGWSTSRCWSAARCRALSAARAPVLVSTRAIARRGDSSATRPTTPGSRAPAARCR